ncbi:RING finger protein 121 [Paragonimus westermani]|uniref:RING finger protein 121 n=1 Tax=Paragonimus westermani TaxID=34504 RepID=A0A5J4NAP2_9TREM|nr:RING finger protein 121 [Paragonimus westermani]
MADKFVSTDSSSQTFVNEDDLWFFLLLAVWLPHWMDKMDSDVIVLNNVTYHLSKLPPEEQMRIKHLKLHEMHRGHEEMHLEMFIIAMVSLFVCQVLLMTWKKYHFKTYQFATLIAMWTVPFVYSLFARFPRFIVIWFLFSLITGSMVYMASKKRISTTTPR